MNFNYQISEENQAEFQNKKSDRAKPGGITSYV